jgi:hypothetical protein
LWAAREEKSAKANGADVVRQLQGRFARAMEIFEAGPHRTRTCSNDPTERLNQEIRRGTRAAGIFPHCGASRRSGGRTGLDGGQPILTRA